ncbi:MAG TPA: tetratricopeptide repeat protein [Candidatus Binatia bacterium]|jgi:tetratricopeptide (TPR) repeat protein|nr:tetratricopeptide repeat protein [Candidatus Binatia bacterium]
MRFTSLTAAIVLLWVAACATLQSQSDFLTGRRALLRGEPDNALSYFERIAKSDATFISNSVSPRRSIWTYVGRAQYNSGRYNEARSAFEKALSHLSEDYVARLYLGLTLLRPSGARAPTNAFNLQEVTYALREGVEPKRVAALARERGVIFDLTKETESQLRNAGADASLLNELKIMRAESAKQNKVGENQRTQGGKELTAALNGLREWLEYTVAYTPQGKFWDPAQEIRNQIQVCLKQLTARPTDWDTLISNAELVGFKLEDESDRARRDEAAERDRQQRR